MLDEGWLDDLPLDALLEDDAWLRPALGPAQAQPAGGSRAIPIKGACAGGPDLQDSSLESTQSILGATDDAPAGSYQHRYVFAGMGSFAPLDHLLQPHALPQQPSHYAALGGLHHHHHHQQQQQQYYPGSTQPVRFVPTGPSPYPQQQPLQQQQQQPLSLSELDSLLGPAADPMFLPDEDEEEADPFHLSAMHYRPPAGAPRLLPQQPYPPRLQPQQPQQGWQQPAGLSSHYGAGGAAQFGPPQFVPQPAARPELGAFGQQQPLDRLQQQQQQQQGHLSYQGMMVGEEEEEDSELHDTDATQDSDVTMHAMNSPGKSPVSHSPSVHDTATGGGVGRRPPRRSSSVRSAASAGAGAAGGRLPAPRMRLVVKQPGGAPRRPAAAGAGAPARLAGAAETAAAASGRPRRAAALRRQRSYASALEDFEYELDEVGPEEDGLYESGEEEVSLPAVAAGRVAASAAAPAPAAGVQPNGKKKHNPWSQEETEALIEGVRLVGVGKWAEIKKLPLPAVAGMLLNRSAVDLKDKWRNLSRVARLPKSALKSRLAKGGSDTPLELVLAVKELLDSTKADHREWR